MIRTEIRLLKCLYINGKSRYSTSSTNVYSDKIYKLVIDQGYEGLARHTIPENYGSNQVMASKNDEQLGQLIGNFKSPIKFSIGYGSGVFEQTGYKKSKKPQIDMIHMVDNPAEFHEQNLKQFSGHYSGIRMFGPAIILKIQEYGAGVYFNPYITMNTESKKNNIIKYGIISVEKSLIDLSEWSSLYIAGRLQKPVKYLKDADPAIKFINQYNLKNAMSVGLFLIKPSEFTEIQLYETIAKISYMGDPRMLIGGENPNKARNIVGKQFENFQKLYNPLLNFFIENNILVELQPEGSKRRFKKNLDNDKTSKIIGSLPLQFRRKLYKRYTSKFAEELSQDLQAKAVINGLHINKNGEIGPFTKAIAMDPQLRKNLVNSIKLTVTFPALIQTIKGIFSAGIIKSINYAWEKRTKYRHG